MSRRRASLLALTVAAIGSIATKTGPMLIPMFSVEPVVVDVDRDGQQLTVEFETTLTDSAPNRLELDAANVTIQVAHEVELPRGVVAYVSTEGGPAGFDSDAGAPLNAAFDVQCSSESCAETFYVYFDVPSGTDPFTVDVGGFATFSPTIDDRGDLDVRFDLSGPGTP